MSGGDVARGFKARQLSVYRVGHVRVLQEPDLTQNANVARIDKISIYFQISMVWLVQVFFL